jgi:hypothetical protein
MPDQDRTHHTGRHSRVPAGHRAPARAQEHHHGSSNLPGNPPATELALQLIEYTVTQGHMRMRFGLFSGFSVLSQQGAYVMCNA